MMFLYDPHCRIHHQMCPQRTMPSICLSILRFLDSLRCHHNHWNSNHHRQRPILPSPRHRSRSHRKKRHKPIENRDTATATVSSISLQSAHRVHSDSTTRSTPRSLPQSTSSQPESHGPHLCALIQRHRLWNGIDLDQCPQNIVQFDQSIAG